MRKCIYLILILIVFSFNSNAQSSVSLEFKFPKPFLYAKDNFGEPGNLSYPQWSKEGDWIGMDFSQGDKLSVAIISIEDGTASIYNVQERPNRNTHSRFNPITTKKANTLSLSWSPENNNVFFVISSLKLKYDLYFVRFMASRNDIRFRSINQTSKINELDGKHISFISFTHNPNDQLVGIFSAGDKTSSNIWIVNRKVNDIKLKPLETNNNVRAYDSRALVKSSGEISVAYEGIEYRYSDIFYISDISANSMPINISKSSSAIEKYPRWNSDGRYLAYLSTFGHINLNGIRDTSVIKDLKYGLYVYDTVTNEKKEIYFPVYVHPERSVQNVFAWLPNSNDIIIIKEDIENKNPLVIVNIEEQHSEFLDAGLIYPSDICISPDGEKIAITARGHEGGENFEFLKLYVAEIKK